MDKIAQEAQWRQRMMKYLEHHGVEETANRYRVCRQTVWKWRNRWDGTWESLKERTRRPKHFARKQSREDHKLVHRLRKKYGNDLLLAYQKAMEYGYKYSYGCFKRTAAKEVPPAKKKKQRHNKPYQRAAYPGEKIQLDVKYVPSYCVADGGKYYQYTAKDECTRWTFREMYAEHSTYSSKDFLEKLVLTAPFPIRQVQTDNGTEFTNELLVEKAAHKTLFEQALLDMGIEYRRIRIATPRHNGKVERQHRTDEMRFYQHMRMFNLEDGRRQLALYQKRSNDYIMTCLGMKSPNKVLALYLGVM